MGKNIAFAMIISYTINMINPLKAARLAAGYKKVIWLANETGFDYTTLWRIETGRTRRPHPHGLKLLADKLGVEAEALSYALEEWNAVQAANAAERS
jgi:transcriptional regulator with XRE-family HTH domain